MADLGLAFDDEDLIIPKKDTCGDITLPYHVKINTPKWFEDILEKPDSTTSKDLDDEHLPYTIKFSADYNYYNGNFEKAVELYKSALDILPDNNSSTRQDMRESLCRCYSHLNETECSLNLAREIVKELSTEDEAKQRQSLILLSSVCERAGRWEECVETLERLSFYHPLFPQTWEKLGDAFTSLALNEERHPTFSSSLPLFKGRESEDILRLTCYLRAKLLFLNVLGTASEFTKARNKDFIKRLSYKIDGLRVSDSEKLFASEVIQTDIESQNSERKEDENCSGLIYNVSLDSVHTHSLFCQRFCTWYKMFLRGHDPK